MRSVLTGAFLNGAGAITLLALLLLVESLYRIYGAEARRWRDWIPSAGAALLGAVFAFVSTKIDFKVLSDETNLLSVANMLIQFGKASNTEMWTYYYHLYHALDVNVPTRPILFPLLTALVHGLNGMRWWSPFVVNFFCLWALFFLALEWAKEKLGYGFPGQVLTFLGLAMSPVLLINATSAGFDLCSLLFGFLSARLLERHLRAPTAETFRALVYALVCFASVRYESIVALPLVAGALFLRERGKHTPWSLYITAGFLLLPLFVQRYLTWGSFENPPGVPAFSPMHAVNHFGPFVEAFFLDPRGPYPIVLHWLGLAGLALALPRLNDAGKITLAYLAFLLVLLLSHHFGFAGHPTQARLFLTLSFALSLGAIYFLFRVRESTDARGLLAVFAILLYHHHQYAVSDPLMSQLTMTREVRHLRDFLAEGGGPRDLYVYDRPGQLTALGESAISVNHFNANTEGFLENVRRHLYDRIVVIEKTAPGRAPAVKGNFTLEPLRQHQLSPDETLVVEELKILPPVATTKPAPLVVPNGPGHVVPPAPAAPAAKPAPRT